LDARRNIDRQRALLLHMSRAIARRARVPHHAAGAPAFRTGAFNGEEALAGAHLAVTGTGRAGFRFGTGFRAAPAASFAVHQRGYANLRVLSAIGVFERDLHVVAEIAAAILPARPLTAAHEFAEEIVEHIGEVGGEVEAVSPPAHAALLECR